MASDSGFGYLSNLNPLGYSSDQASQRGQSRPTDDTDQHYQSSYMSTTRYPSLNDEANYGSTSGSNGWPSTSFPWYRTSTPGVSTSHTHLDGYNDRASAAPTMGDSRDTARASRSPAVAVANPQVQQYAGSEVLTHQVNFGLELEDMRRKSSGSRRETPSNYTPTSQTYGLPDTGTHTVRADHRYTQQSTRHQQPQPNPQYHQYQYSRRASNQSLNNAQVSPQTPQIDPSLQTNNNHANVASHNTPPGSSAGFSSTPILPIPVGQASSPSKLRAYQDNPSGSMQTANYRPATDVNSSLDPNQSERSLPKYKPGSAAAGVPQSPYLKHPQQKAPSSSARKHPSPYIPRHTPTSKVTPTSHPPASPNTATESARASSGTASQTPVPNQSTQPYTSSYNPASVLRRTQSPLQLQATPKSIDANTAKKRKTSELGGSDKARAMAVDALALSAPKDSFTVPSATPDPPLKAPLTTAVSSTKTIQEGKVGEKILSNTSMQSAPAPDVSQPEPDQEDVETRLRRLLLGMREIQASDPLTFSTLWQQLSKVRVPISYVLYIFCFRPIIVSLLVFCLLLKAQCL